MIEELKEWWAEREETGQHHAIVLLAASVPAPVALWATLGWRHALMALILGVTWWDGYYGGRERIFEKAGGDHSSGGRWRDWLWPAVVGVIVAALAFGLLV